MHFPNVFAYINHDITIKLLISLSLGIIIGIERELTNKAAGLRTHILVCIGSTVFTILSIHGFPKGVTSNGVVLLGDPARVAAQILAGIGFIGGGAVLRHGVSVRGLTTAASLWITASIGMAVGTGDYGLAVLTAVLSFSVLVLIRYFERYYLSKYTKKGARIQAIVVCPLEFISEIQDWFYKEFKNNIIEMNSSKTLKGEDLTELTFVFDYFGNDPIVNAHKKLNELKYIDSLSVKHIEDES